MIADIWYDGEKEKDDDSQEVAEEQVFLYKVNGRDEEAQFDAKLHELACKARNDLRCVGNLHLCPYIGQETDVEKISLASSLSNHQHGAESNETQC